MRKILLTIGLALLVLFIGITCATLGKNDGPRVAITSPKNGDSLAIGEKIDIYANILNLEEEGRHRVWFSLEIRKAEWADTEWSTVLTSSSHFEDNTAFPSQNVDEKDPSWEGLAVVWNTSLPITYQGREEELVAGDLYYLRIGIAESIHGVHELILSQEVVVSFVVGPTPLPTPDLDELPIVVLPSVLRIAPYTKGPYYTNETITFQILVPEEPGNIYKAFMWDFGDGNSSFEVAPVHQYLEAKSYTVKLTAWQQVDRREEGKAESETYTITVLSSPSPVTASRAVIGFPSFIDRASSVAILPGFDLRVRLSVTVHNPMGAYAFIVREQIPDNWSLIDGSSSVAGVSGADSHTVTTIEGRKEVTWIEWLLSGPFDKGEIITIHYDLSPNPGIPFGGYELTGEIAISSRPTEAIEGDSTIKLVSYLPLEVVIAHIDTVTASKICSLDADCLPQEDFKLEMKLFGTTGPQYTISSEQLDAAICLWEHNCVVPYTDGQMITYTKLLELIERYELGTP